MAYDKNELEAKAIEVIKDNEVLFIDELATYLPCSRGTFYNLDLHKLDTLKEALETNKMILKQKLRSKWLLSDNATLQIALYKLLANDSELEKLSNHKTQLSINQERPIFNGIDLSIVKFDFDS